MPEDRVRVRVTHTLPFWWKAYAVLVYCISKIPGTKPMDVQKTAKFIAEHAKYDVKVMS